MSTQDSVPLTPYTNTHTILYTAVRVVLYNFTQA